MRDEAVICGRCNSSSRSSDLTKPCGSCGARKTILGYLYEHEFRELIWALIIITTIILLAIVAGIIFLIFQWLLLTKTTSNLPILISLVYGSNLLMEV